MNTPVIVGPDTTRRVSNVQTQATLSAVRPPAGPGASDDGLYVRARRVITAVSRAELPREGSGNSRSYSLVCRSRSALAITDTELNVIAALAQIGLISSPANGIQHAGRDRHADGVVDERQEQVLPDVPHRRPAEPAGADDAAQVAAAPA